VIEGQTLWLLPSMIPAAHRPAPDDPRLRVTLATTDGSVRFEYQPPGQSAPEQFAPSAAWIRIRTEIEPGFQTDRRFARVDTSYSTEPGGMTLGALAEGPRALVIVPNSGRRHGLRRPLSRPHFS
jgi:hypothetical protein